VITQDAKDQARKDTLEHIDKVRSLLLTVASALIERGHKHDASKLKEPELSLFAEWGPKLKQMKYGSDEYNHALAKMGRALKSHYEQNRHHPEFHKNGVDDMNLIDIIEMVCDWKASTLRVQGGNFRASLEHNQKRFGLSPQLTSIIANTAELFEGKTTKLQW